MEMWDHDPKIHLHLQHLQMKNATHPLQTYHHKPHPKYHLVGAPNHPKHLHYHFYKQAIYP